MYHFDLKNCINGCIFNKWKEDWLKIENNHLKKTLPTITKYDQMALPKKQQIILNRLKIGHCIFSHQYLFDKQSPPFCVSCNKRMNVHHLLIECSLYNTMRDRFKIQGNLKNILVDSKDFNNLFQFLRVTRFLSKNLILSFLDLFDHYVFFFFFFFFIIGFCYYMYFCFCEFSI